MLASGRREFDSGWNRASGEKPYRNPNQTDDAGAVERPAPVVLVHEDNSEAWRKSRAQTQAELGQRSPGGSLFGRQVHPNSFSYRRNTAGFRHSQQRPPQQQFGDIVR